MTPIVIAVAATLMAAVIFARCLCVLYLAAPKKHRHPLLFAGFGYSYVTLGAGALFGAVALVVDIHDLTDVALLLMMTGSTGLIIFDRRSVVCISSDKDCPLEPKQKDPTP